MNIGGDHVWVPFFTHTSRAFGVISLYDWVWVLWPSNPLLKLAKQMVNASIIFITSITLESPSQPLDCSTAKFLLSSIGLLDLLIPCILQCSKLITIWPSVSLKSIMMVEIFCFWTSLWFQKWFPFGFRPDHWLVTRLI